MMQATDVQMIADRWMLESRRLINWGSYEGYHEFRPSTDHKLPVTLLAGASESGKSTLVDAQISLLYPTGTPFNKASNSGRSERSDYTYLRGMVGVGSTETGDEPLYLRGRDENGAPQPVWGAIVDTYRNQTTGQVLSCAKFLYLMPGDGRGDVRRQYVVWGKPVDPRRMDQYRDAPFTPAQLKATYPDCLTFPSAEAFHTHIWSAMGLSEAACRLLHKIQSADAPSRLDDIFKQGVLGVPEALDLARTTVEDYERYDENFHAMDEKTRRMDTLRGIQQAYGEYAAARGKARAFEPVKPAVDGTVPAVLRDWALARMRGEVAVQLPADRAEQQNSEAEAKLLRRRTEDLRTRLDMIRGQMQGLDGGNLTRLELELDQARRTLEDVQANRTRIEQTFASIGETLPGDEQAWNERRINAVNFKREYNKRDGECEEALTAAINARAGARGDLERLQRDFDRQRSQRTRISQQMDETRAMLCRATGLTPAELPYVAELMDVNEHEEDWRLAMNVAYAPIAQTILVDKRHEQGFAAKVSTIDPRTMPRRTWQFVDTARHYDDTGAQRTITDTQDAIASIKNDPKLAELAKQRDELNAELDRVERQRIESDQAAARAGSAVEAALIWLRDHADTGTTDAAGATADNDDDAASGPLPDEVTAALAESYDNRFAGLADAAMRAHMIIGAGAAGTQAPGESFPERTIAGIGKDMASRINLLNGQADAARTGVESKMSTYIALYAADDDSLTASVEDYRYYLDELASLTQLAAVAATDAEYRRCLEQLLRSFLTIKRAIDTDASDIHDQLDRINAMLKGQQFGPKHGSLSLHADVRRPERTFWAQLIRVIGTLNDWKSADVNDSDASRKAFAACAPMVGLLRAELAQVKDANGVKSYGARNLDPRCRSSFYAIVHHADGPDERITSTGGRSGGALQELTSFVYGAALIYLLGGGLTSEPSYTTLFLDEALIKADGRYTQRALTVLPRLGFQVIVSAPESKTGEILEVSTKAYVTYKDPDTGLTSLREAVLHQNDMDDESSSDILKDDGVAE